MKHILSLLFVLYTCSSFFAQKVFDGLIEYHVDARIDGFRVGSERYFLLMNQEESFGFRYGSKEDYTVVKNNFELKKSVPKIQYVAQEEYFIYSIGINKFRFFKDKFPKMNWKVLKGEKEILGFKCQKAIGDLRGRTYIVWFTNEIPYSYGPWKLNGLPGVILEFTDKKKLFSYKAVKISLNKSFSLPNELEEKWTKDKIYDYRYYVKWHDNYLEKINTKIRANAPKGTKFSDAPLRDTQPELIFEWEKDEK